MGIVVLGVSHKTAPIELRERMALAPERLRAAVADLRAMSELSEFVLLSTCNRFEVYARPSGANASALDGLVRFFGSIYDHPRLTASLYKHESLDAVQHLFRVSAGLDSLVVGETEILGQVKAAYGQAQIAGATGKITNVLFQRALFVGKNVRVKTSISEGSSSVGSTAVQLAERIFGPLGGHRVLLIGAGKMAEVTARHLLSQKAGTVVVLNRTLSRAEELASLLNGRAAPMEHLEPELLLADIVICSTSADKPVIARDRIQEVMKTRRGRSLYFIDISVPRNVEPEVHELDNVYVYNIDDLRSLVEESLSKRRSRVSEAEAMVDQLSREFYSWAESVREGRDQPLRHQVDRIAAEPRA